MIANLQRRVGCLAPHARQPTGSAFPLPLRAPPPMQGSGQSIPRQNSPISRAGLGLPQHRPCARLLLLIAGFAGRCSHCSILPIVPQAPRAALPLGARPQRRCQSHCALAQAQGSTPPRGTMFRQGQRALYPLQNANQPDAPKDLPPAPQRRQCLTVRRITGCPRWQGAFQDRLSGPVLTQGHH